ncbi:hypothetical protein ACWIUD_06095 [Helicobacter sp. 23-1044]
MLDSANCENFAKFCDFAESAFIFAFARFCVSKIVTIQDSAIKKIFALDSAFFCKILRIAESNIPCHSLRINEACGSP